MGKLLLTARLRWSDPAFRIVLVCGSMLLTALTFAVASSAGDFRVAATLLLVGGCFALTVHAGVDFVQLLRKSPAKVLLASIVLVGSGLVLLFALQTNQQLGFLAFGFFLSLLSGFALIGDELRTRIRNTGLETQRSPWQQLTAFQRVLNFPWQAGIGVLSIAAAAFFGFVLFRMVLGGSNLFVLVIMLGLLAAIAVMTAVPIIIGAVANTDQRHLAQVREDERKRVSAHLHDSVLQTLSLIQRQADSSDAVIRLARQQERALRSWMAGQPTDQPKTLASCLQATVETVEEEEATTIDITVIGDRPFGQNDETLVAAMREALRNAARHTRGAEIIVFAQVDGTKTVVYIRDQGPGFDLEKVALQRRGIRDSIVGRMELIGGKAVITSSPGEGTEVELRVPNDI